MSDGKATQAASFKEDLQDDATQEEARRGVEKVRRREDGRGYLKDSSHWRSREMTACAMGITRSLVGGAAMLNACLQRHHPHASTLFATKFVFEAGMTIAVDGGILLGDLLF
jgi:hypothetical protein